ncbi:hypothetical protein HJC23_002713 [Cyclotella cryptica]|uniref:Uncharacterized protein n=1 Tax=Cyclotella cryptica TaxID=29204 RepID=A0ABD3PAT9_9STRA
MNAPESWWHSLSDECPITLEPLSDLPYPPFLLYSTNDNDSVTESTVSKTTVSKTQYYFDGLALATYVISQGNFANPLTRKPLSYDDCVRLDDYLDEHIYQQKESREQFETTILFREKISVREAFALRHSIKVKFGRGNADNEAQAQRAEVLRNEAAVALRGLFVFGHYDTSSDRNRTTQSSNSQQLPRSAGGFDLSYTPGLGQNHPWGSNSLEQEGLRIIDDNEAAFSAADAVAWQDIQEAFPHLMGLGTDVNPSPRQSQQHDNRSSQLLEVVRRTAVITIKEEREKAEQLERNRRLYFLQALERKKKRVIAKQQAKQAAAASLLDELRAKDELQIARNEIDRWREQQWKSWEKASLKHNEIQNQQDSNVHTPEQLLPSADASNLHSVTELENQTSDENEEARRRAALKKKAKRQRAKERAKEQKRQEHAAIKEKERAVEIQKKKESSNVKCGSCGEGVLGHGFEKFGLKFCSTTCARRGPMPG